MNVWEAARGAYLISTDQAKLDAGVVHGYLTRSYWARGISLDVVRRSLRHSLCFGVYRERPSGGVPEQVGLARVISDYTTFAYLCDVFVLEEHRGQALAKWLIECVGAHPELQGLRLFCLRTVDAHGLYRRYGFEPTANPERWMEIFKADIYDPQP